MPSDQTAFIKTVLDYYRQNKRDLPWREPEADESFDAYKILVSEIMLQQTQVSRVIPKYQAFLKLFPTVQDLANAALGDVIRAWSGLGYNRRAKFLWQAAKYVVKEWNGVFPSEASKLVRLSGVGKETAAAICCYAFNQPVPFIETNVRTVYIHHFFAESEGVTDAQLRPIIEQTWDLQNPRIFGWALMDYGTFLKSTVGNVARKSKTYVKQTKFEGSARQLRGQVLRLLGAGGLSFKDLQFRVTDDRLQSIVRDLETEGFIVRKRGRLHLA